MASRRARRGKKNGKANLKPLIIGAGVVITGALVLASGVLKGGSSGRGKTPTPGFSIADYRRDGSRFASTGNSYVFDGRVESLETIGNDLIICISLPGNVDERLPLLLPGNVRLKTNLTRGDRFLFETSCRTGKTPDGKQVKGVLIVKNAESL